MDCDQVNEDIKFRHLVKLDFAELMEIEHSCFQHPWKENDFEEHLGDRSVVGRVACLDGRVVGYTVFEMHDNRFYIRNLVVAQEYRRRGVGRALLQQVQSHLRDGKGGMVEIDVRESNLAAQLFFRDNRFRATGVVRDFFKEFYENVYEPDYIEDSYHFIYET